ncbi:MAG: hypothetical protein ACOCW6_09720 [Spirochaetota bacterium]
MTRQRRFLLFALGLMLIASSVPAETVLVAVYQSGTGELKDQSRFFLSAVEDGVMDVMFDEGHIVFNLGSFSVVGPSAVQARYDIRETARDGGAAYAVEVTMDVNELEDGTIEPVSLDYRFVNVDTDRILDQGRIEELTRDVDGRTRSWGDVCFLTGQEIARSALSSW